MARTIDEIYNAIMAEKANQPDLDGLNSVSRVAVFKLTAYIMAVVMWGNEKLWDVFSDEVTAKIAKQKLGKAQWYREMAFAFQYGQQLPDDSDVYDNTGLTDDQVNERKIVKYCSVTEVDGKLRIKVALQVNKLPSPLSEEQLDAFKEYMERIRFAGVKLIVDSLPADDLKLDIEIWYNPLVLRSDGSRIDGSDDTPVPNGIRNYLNNLKFNGEYANTRLANNLEAVDGVEFPVIKSAQTKYGLFPFTAVDEKYIPDAGYLKISDANLNITYRQYVQS